ncbi:MAG: HAMP domain-containing histidine kinase [Oscillospiraceae bacterium]|nr:HAMP domain-containing histidine kinase [Oscillospiraceae bacterium]
MTKALQRRFVRTAMAAITILLAILLSTVNIANIIIVNQQAEKVMSVLTAGRGSYDPSSHRQPKDAERQFPFFRRPTPDDMMGARYFYVRFDSAGNILRTNLKHIYAVTDEQARQIAQELYGGEPSGQYEQFQYQTIPLPEDKGQLVLFLDTSTQQESIVTVLLISLGVGLLCWTAMLLLVTLLSRQAIAPIAENMEKQKQFVTNAGHEIKTPLSIILANTDALELHNGESKWSKNIRAQAIRLNELMKNLLTLARTDEDGTTLPVSEFSMDLLVQEALDIHRTLAQAKKLDVHTEIQPSVTLKGNRDSIMQLVSVLLDNACKYTPDQGTISLRLCTEGNKVYLQVKNTCTEPPEKDLEKLFDRFYRGDAARTQSTGGYGIGLSAARAITQTHGGTITADYNKVEQVISFTVRI